MKSFDDFLATISDDDYQQIKRKAEEALMDSENKIALADIKEYSVIVSLLLLRRYHQWLSQQLP